VHVIKAKSDRMYTCFMIGGFGFIADGGYITGTTLSVTSTASVF